MVQSLNTKVDLVTSGTSFIGMTDYGDIMIGDKAFEFYHRHNSRKYIQIPWKEVDYVVASVLFKGKWIPRYAIQTKKNGRFIFASKEPKKVLRAMRQYIDGQKMVRSLSFIDVLKNSLFRKKKSAETNNS